MVKTISFLLVVVVSSAVLTSCGKDGDPWDSTNYFEKHRTQSAEQEKHLRDRLFHTQGDNQRPAHQID